MLRKWFELDYNDEKLIYKNSILFTIIEVILGLFICLIYFLNKEVYWFVDYFGYFLYPTLLFTTIIFIIRGLIIYNNQKESKSIFNIVTQIIFLIIISIINFFILITLILFLNPPIQ